MNEFFKRSIKYLRTFKGQLEPMKQLRAELYGDSSENDWISNLGLCILQQNLPWKTLHSHTGGGGGGGECKRRLISEKQSPKKIDRWVHVGTTKS